MIQPLLPSLCLSALVVPPFATPLILAETRCANPLMPFHGVTTRNPVRLSPSTGLPKSRTAQRT